MSHEESSDDFNALRDLALTFLRPRYARIMHGPRRGKREPLPPLTITVRSLPDSFPSDVPSLPDGRLLGALTAGERVDVVMNSDRPPEEIVAWYREQLGGRGWTEPEPVPLGVSGPGGFVVTVPWKEDDTEQVTLCRNGVGPSVQVVARGQGDEATEVVLRANLSTDPRTSPCTAAERAKRQMARHYHDINEIAVPPMTPPPDSRQMGGGGSSSPGNGHISASLETSLDLTTVAAHYDRELEAGGWRREGGAAAGQVAWSRWSFKPEHGDNGRAYLLIFHREDEPGHYDLQLQTLWTPDDEVSWDGGFGAAGSI